MAVTGGCLCGAVRYEAEGEPLVSLACHCRDCLKSTGGAPTYAAVFRRGTVRVTAGEPRTYWKAGDSGKRVGRSFCPACGAPVFSEGEANPGVLIVKAGSLDDPSRFRPRMNIWTRSAAPWIHLDPSLPAFEGNPG